MYPPNPFVSVADNFISLSSFSSLKSLPLSLRIVSKRSVTLSYYFNLKYRRPPKNEDALLHSLVRNANEDENINKIYQSQDITFLGAEFQTVLRGLYLYFLFISLHSRNSMKRTIPWNLQKGKSQICACDYEQMCMRHQSGREGLAS